MLNGPSDVDKVLSFNKKVVQPLVLIVCSYDEPHTGS